MKEIQAPDDRLLTRAEVAEIFQVAPSTITRWGEAGKLPSVKTLGGHRRYEAKAVMELAQSMTQEEASMEKMTIDVPAMYGDHHVLEVRKILLALPGVEEVYASSAFHAVEVDYDPAKTGPEAIATKLDESGYLGELAIPVETGIAVTQEAERDKGIYFRHTTAFEQVKNVVGFGQDVNYSGRPLWHCPGVGIIGMPDDEEA